MRSARCSRIGSDKAQVSEVAYWLIDQTDEDLARKVSGWLTGDEDTRAERFADHRWGIAYTVRHGALRAIVGERLGIAPGAVPLRHTESGRPYLDVDEAPHISLSASGRLAVVACCESAPIGVDIEAPRQHDDLPGVAERFFSRAERRLISALRKRTELSFDLAFLHVWTIKEAYLKALGQGIGRVRDFSLSGAGPDGDTVVLSRKLDGDPYAAWSFSSHALPGDFSLAIASPGRDIALNLQALEL